MGDITNDSLLIGPGCEEAWIDVDGVARETCSFPALTASNNGSNSATSANRSPFHSSVSSIELPSLCLPISSFRSMFQEHPNRSDPLKRARKRQMKSTLSLLPHINPTRRCHPLWKLGRNAVLVAPKGVKIAAKSMSNSPFLRFHETQIQCSLSLASTVSTSSTTIK